MRDLAAECARLERIVLDQQDRLKRLEVLNDRVKEQDAERGAANARLNKENARLRRALNHIATVTSRAIVNNKTERPTSLLDLHSTVIDVQVKARAALGDGIMIIIASGNPFDGLALVGPFDDGEQAGEYAERHFDGEWWIVPVEPPEK